LTYLPPASARCACKAAAGTSHRADGRDCTHNTSPKMKLYPASCTVGDVAVTRLLEPVLDADELVDCQHHRALAEGLHRSRNP